MFSKIISSYGDYIKRLDESYMDISSDIMSDYKHMLSDYISDYNPHIASTIGNGFILFKISCVNLYFEDSKWDIINFLNYVNSTYGEIKEVIFRQSIKDLSYKLDQLDTIEGLVYRDIIFRVYIKNIKE